jgi:hypothetical protein
VLIAKSYENERALAKGAPFCFSVRINLWKNYFTQSTEVYGKNHAIYLAYCPWGTPFPMGHSLRAKEAGNGLQVGWEPSKGLDAVQDDAYVRQWARDAKAAGIPIFLRYASEMNGSWTKWSGDPAKYIERFRLIADIMKEEAPNVAVVGVLERFRSILRALIIPVMFMLIGGLGGSLYTEPYEFGDPLKPHTGGTPIERLDELYSLYADQPPIIQNGSTFVPLRAISENMGATM